MFCKMVLLKNFEKFTQNSLENTCTSFNKHLSLSFDKVAGIPFDPPESFRKSAVLRSVQRLSYSQK